MNRGKVQKVMPVSATAPSRQVMINQTRSILSDPDGRWVAQRLDAISAAFKKPARMKGAHAGGANVRSHDASKDLESSREQAWKLSGESDRIGRREWDENTLFGKHVGFF